MKKIFKEYFTKNESPNVLSLQFYTILSFIFKYCFAQKYTTLQKLHGFHI